MAKNIEKMANDLTVDDAKKILKIAKENEQKKQILELNKALKASGISNAESLMKYISFISFCEKNDISEEKINQIIADLEKTEKPLEKEKKFDIPKTAFAE